jgi:hypothetical protein
MSQHGIVTHLHVPEKIETASVPVRPLRLAATARVQLPVVRVVVCCTDEVHQIECSIVPFYNIRARVCGCRNVTWHVTGQSIRPAVECRTLFRAHRTGSVIAKVEIAGGAAHDIAYCDATSRGYIGTATEGSVALCQPAAARKPGKHGDFEVR